MRPNPARKPRLWLEAGAEGSATQEGDIWLVQVSDQNIPKRSLAPSFCFPHCLHPCTWLLLHPQVEHATAHRISHSNHSSCNGVETSLWDRTERGWG